MKLKAVIVEDEQHAVDLLSSIIRDTIPTMEIVGSAKNVESGIEVIKNSTPDIVFLDVLLSDPNNDDGFDLLQKIGNMNINFKVIFTTGAKGPEYLLKAFKFSAFDYLFKPIIPEELKGTINRVEKMKEKENLGLQLKTYLHNLHADKQLVLYSSDHIDVVNVREIIQCEARNNYTQFHILDGRKLLVSINLGEYEKLLKEERFFRIHRSHLINVIYIKKIDRRDYILTLKDGAKLPISSHKLGGLLDFLNNGGE